MKVILAVFELVIGLTFGSSVLVFFTSLAGISVFAFLRCEFLSSPATTVGVHRS